jgi:uncharacterized membrane protein YGL010W
MESKNKMDDGAYARLFSTMMALVLGFMFLMGSLQPIEYALKNAIDGTTQALISIVYAWFALNMICRMVGFELFETFGKALGDSIIYFQQTRYNKREVP